MSAATLTALEPLLRAWYAAEFEGMTNESEGTMERYELTIKRGTRCVRNDGFEFEVGQDVKQGDPMCDRWRDRHRPIRPADNDRAAWELFAPDHSLPNTGPKTGKIGQIWLTGSPGAWWIWEVTGLLGHVHQGKMLASCSGVELYDVQFSRDDGMRFSVLLFDAPETPAAANDVSGNGRDLKPTPAPAVPMSSLLCMSCRSATVVRGPYAPRADLCETCIAAKTAVRSCTDAQALTAEHDAKFAAALKAERCLPRAETLVGGLVDNDGRLR